MFCWLALLSVSLSSAAPATIGVASSAGTFQVNSAEVDGNANLFEGAELVTGRVPGQVFLDKGPVVTLGSATSVAVYHDHLLLRRGTARIDKLGVFFIGVAIYRVEEAEPASQAVIHVEGDSVQVGALAGSLKILDARGAVLARVGTGSVSSLSASGTAPATPGSGGAYNASANNNNTKRKRAAEALMTAAGLAALYLILTNLPDSNPTSP